MKVTVPVSVHSLHRLASSTSVPLLSLTMNWVNSFHQISSPLFTYFQPKVHSFFFFFFILMSVFFSICFFFKTSAYILFHYLFLFASYFCSFLMERLFSLISLSIIGTFIFQFLIKQLHKINFTWSELGSSWGGRVQSLSNVSYPNVVLEFYFAEGSFLVESFLVFYLFPLFSFPSMFTPSYLTVLLLPHSTLGPPVQNWVRGSILVFLTSFDIADITEAFTVSGVSLNSYFPTPAAPCKYV